MQRDLETLFTNHKRPAVWRDKIGVMHRAIGSQIIPTDRGTFIMWTVCGEHDIPANGAWLQNAEDIVTCHECALEGKD